MKSAQAHWDQFQVDFGVACEALDNLERQLDSYLPRWENPAFVPDSWHPRQFAEPGQFRLDYSVFWCAPVIVSVIAHCAVYFMQMSI